MPCSAKCNERFRAWIVEVHARLVASDWRICFYCAGWGGFVSRFDPSPAGVSLSPGNMEEWDDCPQCVGQSRCSKCGEWVPDAYAHPHSCPDVDSHGSDGLPDVPECWCDFPAWPALPEIEPYPVEDNPGHFAPWEAMELL